MGLIQGSGHPRASVRYGASINGNDVQQYGMRVPCAGRLREGAGVLREGSVHQRASVRETLINKDILHSLAVNPDLLDCDYYRFCELDPGAVNAYDREYMNQYYWADFLYNGF